MLHVHNADESILLMKSFANKQHIHEELTATLSV